MLYICSLRDDEQRVVVHPASLMLDLNFVNVSQSLKVLGGSNQQAGVIHSERRAKNTRTRQHVRPAEASIVKRMHKREKRRRKNTSDDSTGGQHSGALPATIVGAIYFLRQATGSDDSDSELQLSNR